MKRSTFFVVTMVMIIAMTVGYLYWISTRVWPGVERRAVQEVENIISKMVNALATEEDYDVEKLYIVEKNANDEIIMIDFDQSEVNRVLERITANLGTDLVALEKGNMEELEKHNIYFTSIIKNQDDDIYQYYLRMGNVTGNLFLENLGAKVPLRINFIGNINSSIDFETEEYGINNIITKLFLKLELNVSVILPMSVKQSTVSTEIPIAIKMVQGLIPDYYQNLPNSVTASKELNIDEYRDKINIE